MIADASRSWIVTSVSSGLGHSSGALLGRYSLGDIVNNARMAACRCI